MTVSLNLTIPTRIAFNGALVTGIFIIPTGGRVNSMRHIILNENNHADLTIDKGKNCY
jgi:hypothetical protein